MVGRLSTTSSCRSGNDFMALDSVRCDGNARHWSRRAARLHAVFWRATMRAIALGLP